MEGWQNATLGQVTVSSGTIDPTKAPDHEFDYVDVSSVNNQTLQIDETSKIIGREAPSRARRLLKAGDVIFATIRPTLKRIAVVPDHLDGQVCSTAFFVFRPKPQLNNRFLFYYLQTDAFIDEMEKLQTGASYPAVNDAQVKRQLIHFPTIPEQKHIVAILDGAFDDIDKAIANTEKNLVNARELFESYLDQACSQLTTSSNIRLLESLCLSGRVITYGVIKLGDHIDSGVPCLRTSDVRWLRITTEGIKKIRPSLSTAYRRTILLGGEVLVNVRGTLGGVAVAGADMAGWNVSREVAVVPADPKRVNPNFLAYLIATKSSQSWLTGVLKGVAYTGINIEDLRNLPVPIPDLIEQERFVARLDKALSDCRRLESAYSQKLDALSKLKQSILQKSFGKRLTTAHAQRVDEAAE